MGTVSLARTTNGIKEALITALDLIGGLAPFVNTGDRVMLKPNLNGAEGCTNKDLVEALIQLLADSGAREVFMAESTFGDANMTRVFFHQTGFDELACKYDIRLVNLNESQVVETPVANPLILPTLRIAREVFEADKIINLPNMKVHYATGITLALKNLKGLLVGDEKKHFHEVGLDKAIVDLNNTIRPHLHIADCISCMERMGPRGGDMVDLNLIMAAQNPADMDCVACQIMGYTLDEVRHLKLYAESNGIDLSQVRTAGETIASVRRPFKKVALGNIIPGNLKVHEKNACSSCMNALFLSCQLLGAPLAEAVDVHLGSLAAAHQSSGNFSVGFGNCCPESLATDARIKGCPPYPFALKAVLKDKLSQ